MTPSDAPSIIRRNTQVRLEWPDLAVLVYDRPDGLEIGQFEKTLGRHFGPRSARTIS